MKNISNTYIINQDINLAEFISVVRNKVQIEFSQEFIDRVNKSRELVEQWVDEERIIYGVTIGFGANVTKTISKEDAKTLQLNIVRSHATSVGDRMTEEEVRGTMLMCILNLGRGYSGVRIETLERYKEFLNKNIISFAPKHGSVGYLSPEAHIALGVIGEGKIVDDKEIVESKDIFQRHGLSSYELSYKEGLALVSGTTSVTAMAAISLYDILNATKTADIISAMTLEVSKGTLRAFDERVMDVKNHKYQKDTATNIRNILKDSEIAKEFYDFRLQDALSVRCVPQLHGAAKKTIYDAKNTVENEMNSCADNPIIWSDCETSMAISSGNPDSSFIGLEMDSVCMAAAMIAKMSERRNNRLIDGNLSGNPWFLINNPGLNSGLMIPQYTQAGLLNEIKVLATPSVIDNIPTCGNQEDYVAMGYNSSLKAIEISKKLEYILAIELLSAYQSYQYLDPKLQKSSVTEKIFLEIQKKVPILEEDEYLYPYIEYIRELIHTNRILEIAENLVGELI